MFPEYRDLISKLKNTDLHFQKLFEEHNQLDQKIKNIEAGIAVDTSETIESLKKQKLKLKDQIYEVLKKATAWYFKIIILINSTLSYKKTPNYGVYLNLFFFTNLPVIVYLLVLGLFSIYGFWLV